MTIREASRFLEDLIPSVMREFPADEIGLFAAALIKDRTLGGQFLDGSTTEGYSKAHKKRRTKKGLQTTRVDLSFTGGMIRQLFTRSRYDNNRKTLTIELGYIPGISESSATQIAMYHNTLGAGRSKLVRKFIGLTDEESQKIQRYIHQAF